MYCLVPEKPLRLVYGTFYLAIGDTFYDFIKIENPSVFSACPLNPYDPTNSFGDAPDLLELSGMLSLIVLILWHMPFPLT